MKIFASSELESKLSKEVLNLIVYHCNIRNIRKDTIKVNCNNNDIELQSENFYTKEVSHNIDFEGIVFIEKVNGAYFFDYLDYS